MPAPPPARPRPVVPAARPARTLDPASVDVLRQAVTSRNVATRLLAVEALAETDVEAFVVWLEPLLGDPELDVRMAAVAALRRFGSPRARALLASVRDDTDEDLEIRALAAAGVLMTDAEARRPAASTSTTRP